MNQLNPFDDKLELMNRHSPRTLLVSNTPWSVIRDASVFVNDTLELCQASAKQVFGKDVSPEIALGIFDRVIAQIKVTPNDFELEL